MNRKILKHLLWKDARTLGPLALAIPVLVLLFFWALALVDGSIRLDGSAQIFGGYTIWCLLPILVAYGAPAVLVGGEEESGSLAWLRTLPASWRAIAASKLIVTSLCLLIAWTVATLAFLAYWSSIPERWLERTAEPEPFYAHLMGNVTLSFVVMLASFITAYAFRSPITALVAVVPVAGAFIFAIFAVTLNVAPIDATQGIKTVIPASTQTVFAVSGCIALLVMYLLHQWCARQRLRGPIGWVSTTGEVVRNEAFRPPAAQSMTAWYGSSISFGRPTKSYALLWQQFHQMRWHLALCFAAVTFCVVMQLTDSRDLSALGIIIGIAALFSVGSLAFYGDSVHKRCQFFADRGVSPSLVWITRLLPVLVPVLLVGLIGAFLILVVSGFHWSAIDSLIGALVIAASIVSVAQLTSQWSPRPVLTFFAAPVFFAFGAFAVTPLLNFYPNAASVMLLSVVILFYASWRLTPKWMSGVDKKGRNRPYIVVALLAIAVPYLTVLGARWITAPLLDWQWRDRMQSVSIASETPEAQRVSLLDPAFIASLDRLDRNLRPSQSVTAFTAGEYAERLDRELQETRSIGEHISMVQLRYLCQGGGVADVEELASQQESNADVDKEKVEDAEKLWDQVHVPLQEKAAAVLLKWSKITRGQAVRGDASFTQLFGIAENADTILGQYLLSCYQHGVVSEEVTKLCKALPAASNIREARSKSLTRDWQIAQTLPFGQLRLAGQYCRAPGTSRWWLGAERWRASRYLDEAVKTILDGWSSNDHQLSSQELESVRVSLDNAYFGSSPNGTGGGSMLAPLPERIQQAGNNDVVFADLRQRVSRR